MRLFFPLLFMFCLLLGAGCNSESAPPARPLVQVDGLTITKAEFLAAFDQNLQPGQQLSAIERQELQRSFLIQMIDHQLIFNEASRLGITVTPAEVDAAVQEHHRDYPAQEFEASLKERGQTLQGWQEELKDALIMEKLLEQAVYARIEVSDMDIAAYYESHRADFDRPAQVRARQLVVADEAEGNRVLGLLRQGQPFAEVAKQYSLSADAEQGGDLGYFGRGQMPAEFDAVVFDLQVGRLSDLVKSEYGYHIFLVEGKRAAAQLTKQEAAEEIRQILTAEKRDEAYAEWLQDLRAQAVLEVDWNQLDAQ